METLDYEMFYEDIQASGTEQQKNDLNRAVRSAFKEMDDNIRTRNPSSLERSSQVNQSNYSRPVSSFIFTLNQDMFFERYHSGETVTVVPGLPSHITQFREADRDT